MTLKTLWLVLTALRRVGMKDHAGGYEETLTNRPELEHKEEILDACHPLLCRLRGAQFAFESPVNVLCSNCDVQRPHRSRSILLNHRLRRRSCMWTSDLLSAGTGHRPELAHFLEFDRRLCLPGLGCRDDR